jgi:hypothetical protein
MLAWITIYCPVQIDDIAPDRLAEEILLNDFEALASDYKIKQSLVAPSLELLQAEAKESDLWFWYKEDRSLRPVIVQRWTDSEQVDAEVRAAREVVERQSSESMPQISAMLEKTVAVVGIEIGLEQRQDMGIVFAYEIARWFGEHREGLILGDDGGWSVVQDGAFVHLGERES